MKTSNSKSAKIDPSLIPPEPLHHVRTRVNKAAPKTKSPARENIFSKSRDTREDRSERQIKTSRNAQTFPHGH